MSWHTSQHWIQSYILTPFSLNFHGKAIIFYNEKKKKRCKAGNKKRAPPFWDTASLPKLEGPHPGLRSGVCPLLFSNVAAAVTWHLHVLLCSCSLSDVEVRGWLQAFDVSASCHNNSGAGAEYQHDILSSTADYFP